MDELKRLLDQIVEEFPKDEQGLPKGMRTIAERAITDLFCPNGEKLTVPRMGFFDFCPCCGMRAGPEGFKIAWGIALPKSALMTPAVPMLIQHAGRTCVTSMMLPPGKRLMPAAAAERLMLDIAAVGCVTHRDAAANIIADALDGVGGA